MNEFRAKHFEDADVSRYEAEINAALSLLSHAQPAAGMESRIQLRIAEANTTPTHPSGHRFWPIRNWTTRNWAGTTPSTRACAASLVAATVLVAGGFVYHSKATGHGDASAAPRAAFMAMPDANNFATGAAHPTGAAAHATGFGAAAAIRIAPPAMTPALTPALPLHGRHHGRASISSHHKPLPAGVAVPKSPVEQTSLHSRR